MMLEHLGEVEAAKVIEQGIAYAVSQMKGMAAGEMGMGTDAVGDIVAGFVAKG
jgi:isocitrate/isopropylmalate dehydrogenase